MAQDPALMELAAALADLPRWVAPRGLLLEGRCELLFGPEGRKGAGYVVLEQGGSEAFAVHRPGTSLAEQLAARTPRVQSLIAPVENADSWRALLPGWSEQPAVLHVHPAPESLPAPLHPTRFLTLEDLAAIEGIPDAGFPEPLAQELARALQRGPVAAAFDGARAVSFCHAAYRTERWFDLSIDTLESHRRRGFATSAAAFLIRHQLAQGRRPVWGALDADVPSISLAKKYGFRAVDRMMVFVAPRAQ